MRDGEYCVTKQRLREIFFMDRFIYASPIFPGTKRTRRDEDTCIHQLVKLGLFQETNDEADYPETKESARHATSPSSETSMNHHQPTDLEPSHLP